MIKTYLQHNTKIHSGQIFPIGDEPDGKEWTGFQSIVSNTEGYVLVFREDNSDVKKALKTWLPIGKKVSFKPIAGSGKAFDGAVLEEGKVVFDLAEKNSFALYTYSVK